MAEVDLEELRIGTNCISRGGIVVIEGGRHALSERERADCILGVGSLDIVRVFDIGFVVKGGGLVFNCFQELLDMQVLLLSRSGGEGGGEDHIISQARRQACR